MKDNDDFKEIVIEEYEQYFLLRAITSTGGEFSVKYDKEKYNKDFVSIIEEFVTRNTISMIHNRLPIISGRTHREYMEVSTIDNKSLKICLYNVKYRFLYNLIHTKYIGDRYEYLKENNVNEIRLSSGMHKLSYKEEDGIVYMSLDTDSNNNLTNFEKESLSLFLCEKFDYYGGKIDVSMIKDVHGRDVECVVRCGNFKMTFPRTYTFSFINSIIYDYRNGINKNRKR